jgi:hypothetical protein
VRTGEVVNLIGPRLLHDVDDRELIEQVGLVELDLSGEVPDPVEVLGARTADDTVDFVTLFEKQIGEITPILSGDAGNQSALHAPSLPVSLVARAGNPIDGLGRRGLYGDSL